MVRCIGLPDAGTCGNGSNLTSKVRVNEPVNVIGDQADLVLPGEVGYSMRQRPYVSGSGTKDLTVRMNVTANEPDARRNAVGHVWPTPVVRSRPWRAADDRPGSVRLTPHELVCRAGRPILLC